MVIAIDASTEMLKKAQGQAAHTEVKNVRFLLSDGKNLDIEDFSVGVIVLITVYHEIDEHATVLGEFDRVLKPSGRLIIVEVVKKGIFPSAPVQNPEK